jgi:hypothetical protein
MRSILNTSYQSIKNQITIIGANSKVWLPTCSVFEKDVLTCHIGNAMEKEKNQFYFNFVHAGKERGAEVSDVRFSPVKSLTWDP